MREKINKMGVPKRWNMSLNKDAIYDAQELAFEMDMPVSAATVYVSRGLNNALMVQDYCNLGIHKFHDPMLLPDVDKALERICKAIDENQHIHIHGDYDVDGITSVCVMVHMFKKLTSNLTYSVPHRVNDGYDIKPATIDMVKKNGTDLLISVDCGVLAFETATYAKEQGVDLIITDHHMPKDNGELPDCVAVVNPNRLDSQYPFHDLAGVGVAFKLMMALGAKRGINVDDYIHEVVEFVALGTVADVAPMYDENRSLVSLGAEHLATTNKPGVQQLLKVAGITSINNTSIGFFIAPRINAVGRLADSMSALDLLLETNTTRAAYLATQLDTMNKRRQDKQEQVVEEAKALIPEDLSDTFTLVLAAKGWHPGLIGLVAGKIAEEYVRPTLVCTIKPDGTVKGSCRSTREFDILEALKSPGCGELFTSLGGHAFAAGFELKEENIPLLRERLNTYAKQLAGGKTVEVERVIDVDAFVMPSDINIETYNFVSKLAPFGNGNNEPMFMARKIAINEISTVGAGGKHLKMKLRAGKWGGNSWTHAIAWRQGENIDKYFADDLIDVLFKLTLEEYQGRTNLTMIIEDFKLST
jgi:single-stranded-DNA-specific exonuclease